MKHRTEYVDGLRAVAVLAVVVHHAAKYDLAMPLDAGRHFLLEGAHGVDLFFVISGFCLAYPTLAKLRTAGSAGFDTARYWSRRLLRILPPFWVALAIFAAAGAALAKAGYQPPSPAWIEPASWWVLARQFLLLDPTTTWTNGSFWSLAIEFRWYLAFPLLLGLWIRTPRVFGAIAVGSFVAFNFTRLDAWDFATLPAFMLGIVAADLSILPGARWKRLALPACAVAVAAALYFEPRTTDGFYQQVQAGWQAAAFFFVIAASEIRWLRTALSSYPLAVTGLASYSIYLVHEPVIAFLEVYGARPPAVGAAIALVLGFVFWRLVERPIAQGELRDALAARAEPVLAKAFAWLGARRVHTFGDGDAVREADVAALLKPVGVPAEGVALT